MSRCAFSSLMLATAFVALVAAASAQETPSLKGLRPDLAREEVEKVYPDLAKRCSTLKGRNVVSCYYAPPKPELEKYRPRIADLDTLAGEPVKNWLLILDPQSAVDSVAVTLFTPSFDRVVGALTERYGKPSNTETSVVQNRAGASFDQVEVTWKIGDSHLVVNKRSSTIDEMSVSLSTRSRIAEWAQREKGKTKDAAKDL